MKELNFKFFLLLVLIFFSMSTTANIQITRGATSLTKLKQHSYHISGVENGIVVLNLAKNELGGNEITLTLHPFQNSLEGLNFVEEDGTSFDLKSESSYTYNPNSQTLSIKFTKNASEIMSKNGGTLYIIDYYR